MTATPRIPGRVQRLLDRAHPYYHTTPKEDRARLLHLPLAATAEEVDEVTALRLAAWVLEREWYARAQELERTRHEMAHADSLAAHKALHALRQILLAAMDKTHAARLALVNKYAPPTPEMNP